MSGVPDSGAGRRIVGIGHGAAGLVVTPSATEATRAARTSSATRRRACSV